MVQLSHPYMTTEKTIALSRWTFVGKVLSLLFNIQWLFIAESVYKTAALLCPQLPVYNALPVTFQYV